MAIPVMNAGSDVALNYSAISGGATSQGLTGNATVYSPATAISTWLWELIEKPTGSSASLSSTSAQNPTLTNIDTIGTYRLFLRGTDDNGDASESDKLKAPSSAFCTVVVKTQYAALKKPAPGQRDWHDEMYEVIDEVDALRDELDTHVADTTDPHNTLSVSGTVVVGDAPAGSGEILVSTGTTTAEWQTASSGLVATATTSVLGKLKLAESPFDAANPKAVVKDKVSFTCIVPGTLKSGGWTPYEVSVPVTSVGASGPSPYIAVFYAPYDMFITEVRFMLADSGDTSGSYTFSVRNLSSANYAANAAGTTIGGVSISHNSGGAAVGYASTSASVSSGNYIGILCTATPTVPGGGLTVQVNGYQVF